MPVRRTRITEILGHDRVRLGSFITFVTDKDVAVEHSRVKAQRDAINAMMRGQAPNPKVSELLPGWNELNKAVDAYLADPPSIWRAAGQMNHGQQLELDIEAYRKKFEAAGGTMPPAPTLPEDPGKSGPGSFLKDIKEIGLVAGILLIAIQLLPALGRR